MGQNEKSLDDAISDLTEVLNSARRRLAELRKQGNNTKMIDIGIMSLSAKINYAKVSGDEKEIEKIKKILEKINLDIDEISLLEG